MRTPVVVASCAWILCLASCASTRSTSPGAAATADSYRAEAAPAGRFAWPAGTRAAVSLTFDDGRGSQTDVGLPILNAAGVRATFYVSPSSVQRRLTAWQRVVRSGHEIGNHSLRHPCTGNLPFARQKALEDYTLLRMAEELDQASAELERLLGVRPQTFAYPCGQAYVGRGRGVQSYVPLVAERFLAGRGWRDESMNDPAFCDLAQLLAIEMDGLTFEQVKALAEEAAEKGSWLVLAGHEVGTGGRQTTRTDTLRAFCDYARDASHGLWVDTVVTITRHVVSQRGSGGAVAGGGPR